jgi:hypothetical protein
MNQTKQPDKLTIIKIEDESYKTIYIDGIYFVCTESSGQLTLYYDKPIIDLGNNGELELKSVERHFIADLRMSPATFQRIANQLHSAIDQSEPDALPDEGERQ